jgi:hypothetical protein
METATRDYKLADTKALKCTLLLIVTLNGRASKELMSKNRSYFIVVTNYK